MSRLVCCCLLLMLAACASAPRIEPQSAPPPASTRLAPTTQPFLRLETAERTVPVLWWAKQLALVGGWRGGRSGWCTRLTRWESAGAGQTFPARAVRGVFQRASWRA